MKIVVIGGGVSGIVAAHILQKEHEVVLIEAESYLGGHTNTRVIESGVDQGVAVDTGFIVLNDQTYPCFHRFLSNLGVAVRDSDMSFSYACLASGLQYAGTTLNGLFAQRRNLVNLEFIKFLKELKRFCALSLLKLDKGELKGTLGDFVSEFKFSKNFIDWYLFPMGSAIWSASLSGIFEFPAQTFIEFFKNHGLLKFANRPQWQTVDGGSFSYVKEFKNKFNGQILLNSPVASVSRSSEYVKVVLGRETINCDYVVLATHADTSLSLLAQPTSEEARLLGSWEYQKNHTVLHTDTKLLPPLKRAWASWNYLRFEETSEQSPVAVTYHMNRLQGLKAEKDYCVSLNCREKIDPEKIIYEIEYSHPMYTNAAISAQRELSVLQGKNRTYFCGSYFGYGFHEDAVKSAMAVGSLFGLDL